MKKMCYLLGLAFFLISCSEPSVLSEGDLIKIDYGNFIGPGPFDTGNLVYLYNTKTKAVTI